MSRQPYSKKDHQKATEQAVQKTWTADGLIRNSSPPQEDAPLGTLLISAAHQIVCAKLCEALRTKRQPLLAAEILTIYFGINIL